MPQKIKPKQKMVQGEMTGRLMPESERRQREMLMTREMERIRKSQGGKTVMDMEEDEEDISEKRYPGPKREIVKEEISGINERMGKIFDSKGNIPGPKRVIGESEKREAIKKMNEMMDYTKPTSSKRVVAVVTGGKGEVKPKATKMVMEAIMKRVQKLKK